tara:strand:+ start:214 stop:417 length:204 start_codon:yes stop_codon:yes gene_type:complete
MVTYLQILVITSLFFSDSLNNNLEDTENKQQKEEVKFNIKCPIFKNGEKTSKCKVKYIQAPTQWANI